MKRRYETPECEVIKFETEDIVTESLGLGEGGIED